MPSKDIHVLITIPSSDLPGGVANYYRILSKYGADQFAFFTIGSRPSEKTPFSQLIRLIRDIISFRRVLNNSFCNIIILNPSFDPKSLVRDGIHLFLANWHRRKVIVFFRGWHSKWELLIFKRLNWLFRFCFFKADAIIILAAEFKRKLQKLGYSKPIFLETTVVDDEIFRNFESGKYQLGPDGSDIRFRILFLSRIQKEKGIYEAINAFQILKRRHANVFLSIAGDGKELNNVIRYLKQCNIENVEILGHVDGDKKTMAFQQADIFLFPTYGEGMPNAVLEAMAHGLPVVTRPVGGIRDFFEDGKMGYISESLDPEVIATNIERFIQNPEIVLKMGKYNHEYAKQHYAASQVVQRIEAICESVSKNPL